MKHLSACSNVMRQAFEIANKAGELTYAAYSRLSLVTPLLSRREIPLDEVQSEAESSACLCAEGEFRLLILMINPQLGLIRTLRGSTTKFGSFDHAEFDEIAFERHLDSHSPMVHCWYWIRKLQARFFAGDFASALEASLKAKPLLLTSPSFELAEYEFYSALARAACGILQRPAKAGSIWMLSKPTHKQLAIWAELCPENFENRAALVGAEIARIEGRALDAIELYEQAIRSARANGFVHNEALAYEVAARFYAARGFDTFADAYLRNARNCYERWGALGKVKQLEAQHPQLRPQEFRARATSSPTFATIEPPVGQLDVETVVKASQAISSEMVLPRLIEKSPPNRCGECRGRAGPADPSSGWRAPDRSGGYHWPGRGSRLPFDRQPSRRLTSPNPRCIT